MKPEVEIVNEQKVDAVHAEPHLRLLIGAHDPVITVVVHMLEPKAARPDRAGLEFVGPGGWKEPAADLARQHEVGPGLGVEETAVPNFAQPAPVIGRRVVIPDPGVPRRLQSGGGRRLVDADKQFAQRRAPEAELGESHAGLAKFSGFGRIHRRHPSSAVRTDNCQRRSEMRRCRASSRTAPRMIVPVANPCQKISIRARLRKFRVSAMMITPMMVRRILPWPP